MPKRRSATVSVENAQSQAQLASTSLMWRAVMQRTSETIGTIAAALAKAQAQLVNPEKSLVGTIRSDEAGTAERSFRYAPFSLVGIAGEDDLDAPDLLSHAAASETKKKRLNGVQGQPVQQDSHGRRSKANSTPLTPKLDSEASAALREQLTS